jgi:hypothetical protein
MNEYNRPTTLLQIASPTTKAELLPIPSCSLFVLLVDDLVCVLEEKVIGFFANYKAGFQLCLVVENTVQEGDHIAQGLSGTGLSCDHSVLAFHYIRG